MFTRDLILAGAQARAAARQILAGSDSTPEVQFVGR
jgi:hypothetical protein